MSYVPSLFYHITHIVRCSRLAKLIFPGLISRLLFVLGHALGFWHEQSRPDRDEYVTIMWDNIPSGNRHNFNKYSRTQIDSLNVPYDYGSIMHYGRRAFSNNGRDTIVPKKSGV